MRWLLAIMLVLIGCGSDTGYQAPPPNYISNDGLQLSIPEITTFYNGPEYETSDRDEIHQIIGAWADYRAEQWIAHYRYSYDEEFLWSIAREQVIEVVDDWYFPCPDDDAMRCGGYYYHNGTIRVAAYHSPPHDVLITDGRGLSKLPHELEHALGLSHGQMVFP